MQYALVGIPSNIPTWNSRRVRLSDAARQQVLQKHEGELLARIPVPHPVRKVGAHVRIAAAIGCLAAAGSLPASFLAEGSSGRPLEAGYFNVPT